MNKSTRTAFILVSIGILILGLLIWRFPYALHSEDNVQRFIYAIALLCAFIPAAIHRFWNVPAFKYAGAWIGIFLLCFLGYAYKDDLGGVGQKLKSQFSPTQPSQNEDGSVSFLKSRDGHFLIEGFVNTTPVQFMLDTGASKVALTISDAKRLGIDVDSLSFNEPMYTANGMTFGASIQLTELSVGSITIHNVSASVCHNLTPPSLLGMSFLKKLRGFKIEGDHLTLEASLTASN
jgi:aspartyl protease family protein